MDLLERLQDWVFEVLVLPTHTADVEEPSDVADSSEKQTECSGRRETLATADTFTTPEESQTFMVRNLCTGEVLDLRDENKPDFAVKYAHLLSIADAERLENYFEQKRQQNIALWEAAQVDDCERCRDLLDPVKQGSLVAQPNSKGLNDWTVLHIAANQGASSVCALLLDPAFGVDVNARTAAGRTALHLAALRSHVRVAQLLVEHGALVNAQDCEGNTPLHLVVASDNEAMVQWFCTHCPSVTLANHRGLSALEVAESLAVQQLLEQYLRAQGIAYKKTDYGRVPFEGVLLHSSRPDCVASLLSHAQAKQEDFALPSDLIPLSVLGRGMFGEVLLARRTSTGQEYAVKVVQKSQLDQNGLEPYLQTERRVLMSVNSPFILKLLSAFQTAETVVLVLDYVRGGELSSYLHRETALSEDAVRFYSSEVLLALEALHRHHILYRDLKPGNVLIDHEGHVVLIDFGLAKEHMSEDTLTWSFCGSPAYLPPEVLKKSGTSLRADWYQFGVLLFEMLTGAPPFFSHTRDLLFANILKAKPSFPREMSTAAKDLISKLLERDPTKRLCDPKVIKSHPFFADTDWDRAAHRLLKPPTPRLQRPRTMSLSRSKIYGHTMPHSRLLEDWPVL